MDEAEFWGNSHAEERKRGYGDQHDPDDLDDDVAA
jgi:hypothetical protein